MILGDVCGSRDNNFNLIRMIAAMGVLVSHAWPLALGKGAVEPLQAAVGFSLGKLAVFVFFAISGFLIARSFERQPTVGRWLLARGLRLFPGLAVVLILTAAVLGPLLTTLPLGDYARDPATLGYVVRNLGLALPQWDLPGVFAGNPFGAAINGSLWTLFYEVVCYGGVLALGLIGAFRHRWRMVAGLGAFALAYAASHALPPEALDYRLERLLLLGLPFAIGVAFHVWRARVRLHPAILLGLVALTVLARSTPGYVPLLTLSISYGVFLLAYGLGGAVRRYNAVGDLSYGVYIYAFPMQQLMVHLAGPMDPLTNVALAVPPTLVLAMLSWRLVEKPALGLLVGGGSRRAAPLEPQAAGAANSHGTRLPGYGRAHGALPALGRDARARVRRRRAAAGAAARDAAGR